MPRGLATRRGTARRLSLVRTRVEDLGERLLSGTAPLRAALGARWTSRSPRGFVSSARRRRIARLESVASSSSGFNIRRYCSLAAPCSPASSSHSRAQPSSTPPTLPGKVRLSLLLSSSPTGQVPRTHPRAPPRSPDRSQAPRHPPRTLPPRLAPPSPRASPSSPPSLASGYSLAPTLPPSSRSPSKPSRPSSSSHSPSSSRPLPQRASRTPAKWPPGASRRSLPSLPPSRWPPTDPRACTTRGPPTPAQEHRLDRLGRRVRQPAAPRTGPLWPRRGRTGRATGSILSCLSAPRTQ